MFNKFKKSKEKDNTYMTVLNSFSVNNSGIAVVCMIEEGELSVNDTVQINGITDTVVAIEYNKQILKSAESGMIVGILLKNIQKSDVPSGEKIFKL